MVSEAGAGKVRLEEFARNFVAPPTSLLSPPSHICQEHEFVALAHFVGHFQMGIDTNRHSLVPQGVLISKVYLAYKFFV